MRNGERRQKFKDAAHQIAYDYPQVFAQYVCVVIDKVNGAGTPPANEYELSGEPEYFSDFIFK